MRPRLGSIAQDPPTAIRVLWLALSAIAILLWVLGSRELLGAATQSCQQTICDPLIFTAEDLDILKNYYPALFPLSKVFSFLIVAYSWVFFIVAGLIFWRRSDDWIALLVSFTLIYMGAILFTSSDDALLGAYPQTRPLIVLFDVLGLTAWIALLYLFPDGKFLPRRLVLPVTALTAISITLDLSAPPEVASMRGGPINLALFTILIGLGLLAQVHRFRRYSTPQQKQQTKWVLFGIFGVLLGVIVWSGTVVLLPPDQPSQARSTLMFLVMPAVMVLMGSFPVSLGFSILQYRLWNIDILIRRTLIYGALVVLLALVYFGSVLVLQNLLFAISGQERSSLAVVVSTLAIAALFTPLRNRIQKSVDRRFYRRRYDAAQTLTTFNARTREHVDLDKLSQSLLETVDETLQPQVTSLWIRRLDG